MHVLIFAQYFPPDLGGSATRAYNVAHGLSKNDVEVSIITSVPHYPSGDIPEKYKGKLFSFESEDNMNIIRGPMLPLPSHGFLNRILLFITFNFFSLFASLFIRSPDVIWVANPDIFGLPPAIIHRIFSKCPVFFNIDDLSIEDIENLGLVNNNDFVYSLLKFITRFFYLSVDAFTPISPGYVPFILSMGVSRDKINVIRGGVDLSLFSSIDDTQTDNTKFRILYSGSFSIAYDFDQIFLAAHMLMNLDPEIVFIIQGKGEQSAHMHQMVDSMGLDNVFILDHFIHRDDLPKFLNTADVLILPLKDFGAPYPGISTKLYEYQAVGKPIIACTEGQSALHVTETKSGITMRPGDIDNLISAISLLKQDSMLRIQYGTNGFQYVHKYMSISQIGLDMFSFFSQFDK